MKNERNIIGIMSGTSLDGIDAALVRIQGNGLDQKVQLARHAFGSLGDAKETLASLAQGSPLPPAAWARAARSLGECYMELAKQVAGDTPPDLISIHGQTVHHDPPHSIQLINPAPITQTMNCPVVHDLRAADLAAGGEGAPITPLADWILFRGTEPVTVINLGGFCNMTHLPADTGDEHCIEDIEAHDVCPCNHLLDLAARRWIKRDFDDNGATAARGACHQQIVDTITESLVEQTAFERSLGSGDEGHGILDALSTIEDPADALATLVNAIARLILNAIPKEQVRILLAGGGAMNQAFVAAFKSHTDRNVELSDEQGIPAQAREAVAMAVLGGLALDGIPITLPQVTKSNEPTTFDGSWCFPRGHMPS
ncbi:MAG: hypothetical protein CMJ40_06480 [Phycisphaerae bacterium]|nr:hypothetical protein [Phycisphaerae bacterium]